MLIVLLSFLMIFSPIVTASDYENIDTETNEDGEFILKLTPEQYIKLADYISELETENKKLKLQLEQANIELETAYSQQNSFNLTRLSDGITGAGIAAALIVLIAQNL